MRADAFGALARAVAALVLGMCAFVVLEGPFRTAEAAVLRFLTDALTGADVVFRDGASVVVVPDGHPFFRAVLLPSCSAAASVIALTTIGVAFRRVRPRRWLAATVAAVAAVTVGNLLRLTAALVIGDRFGDGALVAFHDSVGGAFTLVYVLTGLVVLVALLLPARSPDPRRAH